MGQKDESSKRGSYSTKIVLHDDSKAEKDDKKNKPGAIRIPISIERDEKKDTDKSKEKMQIEIDLDDKDFDKGFEVEADLGPSDLRTLQELVHSIGGIDNL